MHHAGLATVIDRDFEPERVGDPPFERDRIGVLAGAAQLPPRGRRRLAVLLAGPAPLLDLANAEPHLDDLLSELLGVRATDQHARMAGADLARANERLHLLGQLQEPQYPPLVYCGNPRRPTSSAKRLSERMPIQRGSRRSQTS